MAVDQVEENQKTIAEEKSKGPGRNSYWFLKVRLFIRCVLQRKITLRKLFNVVLCDLAYFFKWTKGSPAPYIVTLEPWNECNAGCLFCRDKKGKIHDINPQGEGFIPKGQMAPEVAKDIIHQLRKDVLMAVLYTNGEPLLYKHLADVIQYATDNGVATLIASNGLLFTEENARAVLEAGVDMIKIQISGYTQDIYSVQIRYGHVDKLKENIRMLAKMNQEGGYGTVIMIDYILYKYNRHQMELVRDFCDSLGLQMNIRPGNPFGGLEETEGPLVTEPLPLKMSCDYLWKVMQVNFNGDILSCCESVVWSGAPPYSRFKVGETDVKQVWRGPKAIGMRNMMNTKGRAGSSMCAQCTRKGICFKW